jgi:hypothetical protein
MLEKLIVLVEEPSMEVALEQLLPKLMSDDDFEIRRFQWRGLCRCRMGVNDEHR